MCAIVPLIVDPFFCTLVDTITLIRPGSVDGGAELLPGRVSQREPHVTLVGLSAKPFIADGAPPPLSEFFFAHCAPQK
jgi:hypothetical protein